MARIEIEPDLNELQANVHDAYDLWAPWHADGTVLTVRPRDSNEDYQSIETVRIEAKPSLEIASFLGKAGIGEAAYHKLGQGFEEHGVLNTVVERHKMAQSSLIATLHLKNVVDTASTHNRLFVSSGGDPEFAAINDIIANPMMGRLNVGGLAAFEALSVSGVVDLALPIKAAKYYGMNVQARKYLSRRMRTAMEERFHKGVAINWSLPGTRGKPAVLADGSRATIVNKVEDNVASVAVENTPWAVPVPMVLHPGNAELEVLTPRVLKSVADVHLMMQEMADTAAELSGEQIFYGLPDGAELAEV